MSASAWVFVAILISIIAAIATIAVIFHRVPFIPTGAPVNEEAKIVQLADKQKAAAEKQTAGSGADARRLSDEELERDINDRSTD